MGVIWRGLAASVCVVMGGCIPRETPRIGAIDPSNNIPAIQEAARNGDSKAIPALVQQLDNDDPAVRFYAIEALQKLTGQTLGYQFYDNAKLRKEEVARWQRWVKDNQQGKAGMNQ